MLMWKNRKERKEKRRRTCINFTELIYCPASVCKHIPFITKSASGAFLWIWLASWVFFKYTIHSLPIIQKVPAHRSLHFLINHPYKNHNDQHAEACLLINMDQALSHGINVHSLVSSILKFLVPSVWPSCSRPHITKFL